MVKEQEQQSLSNKAGNQQGNGQQENNIFKLAEELKNHREYLVKLQN